MQVQNMHIDNTYIKFIYLFRLLHLLENFITRSYLRELH